MRRPPTTDRRRLRFLVDECCEQALVASLTDDGHDVHHVAVDMAGASDLNVIERAANEGRILVTDDKDFGDFVVRQNRPIPGVVLLRVDPADHATRVERLRVLLDHQERLIGNYVVVERARIRFRPLSPTS